MILTGCVAFARHVGPTRVEAELLPQCWEQVSYLHGVLSYFLLILEGLLFLLKVHGEIHGMRIMTVHRSVYRLFAQKNALGCFPLFIHSSDT